MNAWGDGAGVARLGDSSFALGNDLFELTIAVPIDGLPVVEQLVSREHADLDWGSGKEIAPAVSVVDGEAQRAVGLSCSGVRVSEAGDELLLLYAGDGGLEVCHHLRPVATVPVWHCWTMITNTGDQKDVGRVDALGFGLGVSGAVPQVAYVLGWLDGPRVEAPGRPPIPFPYDSWIPRLLYGDGAPTPPPPPEGGWSLPVLRLVRESLTRLSLRSGKRSTYDDHPWVAVMDPGRDAGIIAGLEWTGTWRLDASHQWEEHQVALVAHADGNVHELPRGSTLTSPRAFVGLFDGDWDDACNASRRYMRQEVLPPGLEGFPYVHHGTGPLNRLFLTEAFLYEEVDAAADLGFESFYVGAMWSASSAIEGDFSIGLGDFSDSRQKLPSGLRALSDHVHARGLRFGLWFEVERVDMRTANLGQHPWSPAWLVHQQGQAYRSWLQHVYLLCLGVEDAVQWAIDNVSRAIEAYGVDWIELDGNEWAVCDDASHDHGTRDGDATQAEGFYRVIEALHARYPDLVIENCAGGSQRGDPMLARHCRTMHCHDVYGPSSRARQYARGTGSMYPSSYAMLSVKGLDCSPERLEWRLLNRMLGQLATHGDPLSTLVEDQKAVLRSALKTYKELRPTLHGDRYVLLEPGEVRQPGNAEPGQWEAYEHVSLDGELASVLVYRCGSSRTECQVQLKGLDGEVRYGMASHTGRVAGIRTGSELMDQGLTLRLETPLSADAIILRRQ